MYGLELIIQNLENFAERIACKTSKVMPEVESVITVFTGKEVVIIPIVSKMKKVQK
jgi:hypothetical protein